MLWTVTRLIEATKGKLVQGNPDALLNRISTDTRDLHPGDCFVALSGERHDGHDFIAQALAKEVGGILVSSQRADVAHGIPAGVSVIAVPDTLYALGELARHHRNHHAIPVVGISGSNGKTSTKEMVAGILAQRRKVLKNEGNFNNLIGVPLTLLSLDPSHEAAVVEMGINVPGEMARLTEISSPTVGLITNIHPAHLEGLLSLDQILEEKGRLWSALKSQDLAVVNRDDERLFTFSKNLRARTITYSLKDSAADVKLAGALETEGGVSTFPLTLGRDLVSIRLPVLGRHQVTNALAAAAVAWGMGESPEAITLGLSKHRPVPQRMQMHHLNNGRVLIDDTYNANPESMMAALLAVFSASRGKPLILVLGEMRELGPESASLHRELGRKIGSLRVDQLITLGEMAREIYGGAREAGMAEKTCFHAASHDEAVARLLENLPEHAWILVKGSRGMTLERVVEKVMCDERKE